MSLLSRLRGWIMSRFDNNKLEKVFNIRISSPLDMNELITEWQRAYQGTPSWVGQGNNEVPYTLNLASTIANDIAMKATSEVTIGQRDTADQLLASFVDDEIMPELRKQTEYALAMGSIIARPYYDAECGRIALSWYSADRFIPVEWSGHRCVSGIFVDQLEVSKNGVITYYTKLELHKWKFGKDGVGGSVDITVKAFKSNTPTDLSVEISLESVPQWAGIQPTAHINDLTSPLFVYAPTPFSNNKSFNSKAGVSLYKDGMAHLEEIDRVWNALRWEREFTEGKIFVDQDMMEVERTEDGNLRTKINGKDKRIFTVMEANGQIPKFMESFSPAIRQGDYTAMLKTNLSLLCSACHLDSGAYVYDENAGAVTATEVRTRNQKTYITICDLQDHTLTPALRRIVECVRQMQMLYNLPSFEEGAEIDINYGDSILIDAESDKQNAQRETQMGLRSKMNYLMEYRGLSEKDARKELAQIETETPQQIDFFGGTEG